VRILIITGFGNIIDKVYDYKNIIQTLKDMHAFYKTKKYYRSINFKLFLILYFFYFNI
jgi:hypothetical protein